jgi:hypothetical protein
VRGTRARPRAHISTTNATTPRFAHAIRTGWPRLDGGGTTTWQIWCVTAPGVVVHRIRDDKSAVTFKALVGGYRGTIVCDAAKTRAAGARESPGAVLAGCWAHVFRKFEEAAARIATAAFPLSSPASDGPGRRRSGSPRSSTPGSRTG